MVLRKLLAPAVVVTFAALTVVACSGSGGSRILSGPQALRRANTSAAKTSGYRYDLAINITAAGEEQTVHFSGAYDSAHKIATQVGDFAGVHIEQVDAGGDIYIARGASSWVRLQLDPGMITKIQSQFDPQQSQLQQFESMAGTLRPSGHTTVDGVATTTYSGNLSLERLINFFQKFGMFPQSSLDGLKGSGAQPSGTVTVAVDGQGHMRQATLDLQLAGRGPSVRMDERLHSYDFGKPVQVHVPTASEVGDTKVIHSGTDLTAAISDVMQGPSN